MGTTDPPPKTTPPATRASETRMSGFGTELLLFCGLGYVLLGPQRMHAILQHIARAKAEFERTQREIKSQLATHLDGEQRQDDRNDRA